MALNDGERQVAPTLDGIRRDHVARYEWAAKRVSGKVIDAACGVGYGASILADAGCAVEALDREAEALDYGQKHYARNGLQFRRIDLGAELAGGGPVDTAVCFEAIEHLADPTRVLLWLRERAPRLLVSVPNEDVFPYEPQGAPFHHRHYTRGQFRALLRRTGWRVTEWWGQKDQDAEVEPGVSGCTLIAVAERDELRPEQPLIDVETVDWPVPEHVAILGLGPSLEQYVDMAKRRGGKHAFCDETWGINALGGVIICDRVFHMDDVRIQEIRAKAEPDSNIAKMLQWLKVHPGPVITSRPHPDYPGLVAFPLEAVLGQFEHDYFNSTAAWAIAYAIHLGVKKISLFGIDFTYPNAHDAEKGRACVEFWLGIASARGIRISIAKKSSLMDAIYTRRERLYGYDTVDLHLGYDAKGKTRVEVVAREELPTAEEIEARYDHSRHPNALVEGTR